MEENSSASGSPISCPLASSKPRRAVISEMPSTSYSETSISLYVSLSREEEQRALHLAESLQEVNSILDMELRTIAVHEEKGRKRAITIGTPSQSPCFQRRAMHNFTDLATSYAKH